MGEAAESRPQEQELLILEEVLPEQQNQLGAAVPVPGHADTAPDAHAQRRLRDGAPHPATWMTHKVRGRNGHKILAGNFLRS